MASVVEWGREARRRFEGVARRGIVIKRMVVVLVVEESREIFGGSDAVLMPRDSHAIGV